MMGIWKIGPALAAGNVVVLKPSGADAALDPDAGRVHLGDLPARST